MLDLDDIQHFLLTRPHALAARYEFLSFASPEAGRAWLAGILDTVGNARAVTDAADSDTRWVTVAFTWNGRNEDGQVPNANHRYRLRVILPSRDRDMVYPRRIDIVEPDRG